MKYWTNASLGLLASLCLAFIATACGKNEGGQPAPVPVNQCATQPGTVWNGAGCVYGGGGYGAGYGGAYGGAQCASQPGTVWNGQYCVPMNGANGYQNGYQNGFNSSCGAGLIYTYQGCLPQGTCPIGQAQSQTGCIQAMNINGGYPTGNTGYNNGYNNGYPTGYAPNYYSGGGYYSYPNYYGSGPGVYFYGRL